MIFPAISDARFPVAVAWTLVVVAVVGSSAMSLAGVDKGQIATMMVFVIGFAGSMLNANRIGSNTARALVASNDEVRTTLVESNEARADQMDRVEAVGRATQATGQSTHALVNGAHLEALQTISTMATRIAGMPGATPADREAADNAAATLADHQGKIGFAAGSMRPRPSPLEQIKGSDPLYGPEPLNSGPTDRPV